MVNYTYLEHWIPQQAASEKAMLAEFEAGNYTLANPLVKYNPYLINPLAAVVLFIQMFSILFLHEASDE